MGKGSEEMEPDKWATLFLCSKRESEFQHNQGCFNRMSEKKKECEKHIILTEYKQRIIKHKKKLMKHRLIRLAGKHTKSDKRDTVEIFFSRNQSSC